MGTFTRLRALADLADANVINTARLVDAGVLTEDDLRDARQEQLDAHGIDLVIAEVMA